MIAWLLAPRIARRLARNNDGSISLQGVTQFQLYSTVFVGLGMYFTLNSFANVFSWIHFFSINQSPDYGFHRENSPSYYTLTENGMTLAAGIALTLTARRWAEKLCGKTVTAT